MTVDLLTRADHEPDQRRRGSGRWQALRERRRLARQDRLSACLGDLHQIEAVIAGARDVVSSGWVQNGWFSYRDEQGGEVTVTTSELPQLAARTVTGACLVGAIVHAGGGEAAARSQPVQRALDLTWHTLYGGHQSIRWCPPPGVRLAHVRDLTSWNDRRGRTHADVTGLLEVAGRVVGCEIERVAAVSARPPR